MHCVILKGSWLKIKFKTMPLRIPPAEPGLGSQHLAMMTNIPVTSMLPEHPMGALHQLQSQDKQAKPPG